MEALISLFCRRLLVFHFIGEPKVYFCLARYFYRCCVVSHEHGFFGHKLCIALATTTFLRNNWSKHFYLHVNMRTDFRWQYFSNCPSCCILHFESSISIIYIHKPWALWRRSGAICIVQNSTNSTKSIRSKIESIEELKISKRKQSDAIQRTLRIVKLQGILGEPKSP